MINFTKSVAYRIWLRISNKKALVLLDIIKQSYYGYGYSLYSIQEGSLEKQYEYLLKKGLIKLAKNTLTDKKTSIYPTETGLAVSKTSEEKQKLQEAFKKGFWVILSGVCIAVISGLILHFGFGVGV